MFRGRYTHTVDAKGRVAIPAKFRLQLDEGAVLASWMDGCAAIFPRDSFETLAAKVAALPLANDNARRLSRFLFSNAFDLETDAQGRVVLPASIREWAGPRERSPGRGAAGPRRDLESGALGGIAAAGGLAATTWLPQLSGLVI